MKKKNNTTRNIIIGIVILVVIYFVFKNFKTNNTNTNTNATNSTPNNINNTPTQTQPACTNTTILKRGSKCDRVQWVQNYFNTKVLPKVVGTPLVEDGVFGEKTELAVKQITGYTQTSWSAFKSAVDQKY